MDQSLSSSGYRINREALLRVANYVSESQREFLQPFIDFVGPNPEPGFLADEAARAAEVQRSGILPPIELDISGYGVDGVQYHRDNISPSDRPLTTAEALDVLLPEDFDQVNIVFSSVFSHFRLSLGYVGTAVSLRMSFQTHIAGYDRFSVRDVMNLLEDYRIEVVAWEPPLQPFTVFLGHGPDELWRVLKDGLADGFKFSVRAFEKLPRSGFTISQILEREAQIATAAVLVLVGTDEMVNGSMRGRQNVIHELGYFQARLGWEKAILVVEEGVEVPSNLDGTQQVRFGKGRIREALADVAARLGDLRDVHEGLVTG